MEAIVTVIIVPLFYIIAAFFFGWTIHRIGADIDLLAARISYNEGAILALSKKVDYYIEDQEPLTIDKIKERLIGKRLHYLDNKWNKDVEFEIESIEDACKSVETGCFLLNKEYVIDYEYLAGLAKGRSQRQITYHGEVVSFYELMDKETTKQENNEQERAKSD